MVLKDNQTSCLALRDEFASTNKHDTSWLTDTQSGEKRREHALEPHIE
jgi:hypothetical protein